MSLFGTKSNTSYVQVGYSALHETDGKFSSIHCLKNERITWFGLSKSNLYKSSGLIFQSIPNAKIRNTSEIEILIQAFVIMYICLNLSSMVFLTLQTKMYVMNNALDKGT